MADLKEIRDSLNRILWSGDEQNRMYAVLDAARDGMIYQRLVESDTEKVCLFIGDQARKLAGVAPYLVGLSERSPFTQWILEHGWGKSWGIFAESDATFIELRHHFRSFLKVINEEDGKTLFFRYYDPRVLRVFLPTCDQTQLLTLFGPVNRYYVEAEKENTLIQYMLSEEKLVQEEIQLAAFNASKR